MNTKLILIGNLQNVVEIEKDKQKTLLLQFLNNRNGRLEIIEVKVPAENLAKFEKIEAGKELKILVDLNVFNNKIYYKAIDLLK